MYALCLITVKPGKVDSVVEILKKKRKVVKQVMVVTGRADISVILQGNIDQINQMAIDFKKIKDIVTTETLIEVEVDLGFGKSNNFSKISKEVNCCQITKINKSFKFISN